MSRPPATAAATAAVSLVTAAALALGACGDNLSPACEVAPFPDGDATGHAAPLGAGPGEARAGRVRAADLPAVPSGLATWSDGDFVLANDRVALVIEDVGDSDLYDPWGGRPVGLARVEGGRLVAPGNFGEIFLLTGRSAIVTEAVTVIADGSGGGPAIVRARGRLHPLPFFESIVGGVLPDGYTDLEAAIDYELAPGAEHVDIRVHYASPRDTETDITTLLHAFMYTERTPVFQPRAGFDDALGGAPYVVFSDELATSWAYVPDTAFGSSLAVSGFVGAFLPGFVLPACGAPLSRLHARLVIGGPGVDGAQAAVARTLGLAQRALAGGVTRGGAAVPGVYVHAIDAASGAYLTRATTAADGGFTVHVPAGASVRLEVSAPGEQLVAAEAGTGAGPVAIALPPLGRIRVTAHDGAAPLPARVQVLPAEGQALPSVPARYGVRGLPAGRLRVEYPHTGELALDVPPGAWEVIVSRGYEYELVRETVTVAANAEVTVDAQLDRSVDTTGDQCADFHIHTWRSNDSGDDALEKVRQALADGLELPVRSEHEFVDDFSAELAALGAEAFATGLASIEMSSFETWGHMGVFPLAPDRDAVNGGAPLWQSFPTAAAPDRPFATLTPPQVFEAVRARPEAPVIIINHPRGGANYFTYVGFDPATGLVTDDAAWDTKFTLVEVFNNKSWVDARGDVTDWFGLLRAGRKVFAVGSSDSHSLSSSPVGYPRTCITLGTDDPRAATRELVRDRLAAGRSTISGGVYVTARLGGAGPGETTTGAGSPQLVDVTIRAATWIDVDAFDVVVDGVTHDTIPIMPGDADPSDPTVRWRGQVPVQTAALGGFVVIAAYGDATLEPVHRGRKPFGVTNPIFVVP